MTALELTTLDKLRAVVTAQVAGGHEHWEHLDSPTLELYGYGYVKAFSVDGASFRNHVLEVLLDPMGLRSAYGGMITSDGKAEDGRIRLRAQAQIAAYRITDAWLSTLSITGIYPRGKGIAMVRG